MLETSTPVITERRAGSPLRKTIIWLPLLVLPPLLLAFIFSRYVVNMPYQDDFDGLLAPVTELSKSPGFLKSLEILYVQDDERRIIVDRLLAFIIYRLNGIFDHRLQILVGSLTLLGFWLLFGRSIRRLGLGWWAVVPVSLILFQPRYYENIMWSMLPAQHFAVFFFSAWTFCLLAKPQRWAFAAAFLTAILAIGSDSNGSLGWAIGVLILLYQQRYRRLATWVLLLLPVVFLYYYKLEIPAYRPKLSDNLLKLPAVVVHEFLAFAGIPADPGPKFALSQRILITTIFGVPLFLAAVWWTVGLLTRFRILRWPGWLQGPAFSYQRHPESAAFMTGTLLLLLLTMLTYAAARAGDGLGAIYISRYKLIACLMLLTVYGLSLLAVAKRWREWVAGLFTAIGLLFFLSGYFQYWEGIVNFRRTLLVDAYSWQYTRTIPSSPIYLSFRKPVDAIVLNALEAGIYKFPEGIYTSLRELAGHDTTALMPLEASLSLDKTYLNVHDERFRRGDGIDDGAYTVLHGDSLTYLFTTVQNRYGIRQALTNLRYFADGYQTTPILIQSLEPGLYRLGTLIVQGNQREVRYSRWKLHRTPNGAELLP